MENSTKGVKKLLIYVPFSFLTYGLPDLRTFMSIGDKFGESLGGSQATPSFWEVPGLPRKFPELPRKVWATSPEVLSLWN